MSGALQPGYWTPPNATQTWVLQNVLFGDVILCGGQSNAVFSVPGLINASAEVALAGNPAYRSIRIMTVGDLPKEAAPQAEGAGRSQRLVLRGCDRY
jgi:hypothetical protein